VTDLYVMERRIPRPWRGVQTIPLLYTSRKRCAAYVNPRRPTWRCKDAPTVLVRQVKTGAAMPVCQRHVREYRAFLRVAVPA